jgi:transcriptional regulator with XRE-family HTH domain
MAHRLSGMGNYGAEIQTAIAEELRSERAVQRITMDEVAERAGMVKITLHRYMHGDRDIPVKALADICRALNVPMGEIIDRAEDRLAAKQLKQGDSE